MRKIFYYDYNFVKEFNVCENYLIKAKQLQKKLITFQKSIRMTKINNISQNKKIKKIQNFSKTNINLFKNQKNKIIKETLNSSTFFHK